MLAAGKLDRRITIQQAAAVRNNAGEKTRTWSLLAKVWAGVLFPSTRQAQNSQQLASEIDATFTIRYRTDVAPQENIRILFDGKYYRVTGVRELDRRAGLMLDCTARAE
jgi:SPP1 family predicted phage head-tail adaptor